MKTKLWMLGLVMMLALALSFTARSTAQAQAEEYRLNVNRSFGYSSGSDIRGTFNAAIVGDEAMIKSVDFMIDGQVMQTVSAPPYKISFKTGDYPAGMHELTAVVATNDGRSVTTAARRLNFVTAEQESQGTVKVIVPILVVVMAVTLLGVGSQFLLSGGKKLKAPEPGTRRNYGMAGGTVCRHCGRPTPRHFWGINLVAGKLDRCENCGKWSLMMRASDQELRAAEDAEREMAQPTMVTPEKSEEEKLKDMLDSSRFTDSQ